MGVWAYGRKKTVEVGVRAQESGGNRGNRSGLHNCLIGTYIQEDTTVIGAVVATCEIPTFSIFGGGCGCGPCTWHAKGTFLKAR